MKLSRIQLGALLLLLIILIFFTGVYFLFNKPNKKYIIFEPINKKWELLGREKGLLGFPIQDEITLNDNIGKFVKFQNGYIYWSPNIGAFEIKGRIFEKWQELDGEIGVLGYPKSDEIKLTDDKGSYTIFEHGAIVLTPEFKAFFINNSILKKWKKLGLEKSVVGYPVSDEFSEDRRIGKFNFFKKGVIIVSSDSTEAFEVHGAIYEKYVKLKGISGILGYPISDELDLQNNKIKFTKFQNGQIIWHKANKDTLYLSNNILKKWNQIGGINSEIGFPIMNEKNLDMGSYCNFEKGYIYFNRGYYEFGLGSFNFLPKRLPFLWGRRPLQERPN